MITRARHWIQPSVKMNPDQILTFDFFKAHFKNETRINSGRNLNELATGIFNVQIELRKTFQYQHK
jgi:hypothetical protein